MPRPRQLALSTAALLLIGGVAVAAGFVMRDGSHVPEGLRGVVLDEPAAVYRAEFKAESGPVVFPTGVSERWTLLALGYTHCPDVCPFLLGNLAEVERVMMETLPEPALPRVIFLSVDPARDSPEYLAEYAGYFSDRFLGVTGSPAQLDRFLESVGGFYRLEPKDENGDYAVFHSAEVFLIDPKGRLFARLRPPLDPVETTKAFEAIRRFYRQTQT